MAFDPSVLYTFGVVAHYTASALEKLIEGKPLTHNEQSYVRENAFLNEGHNKLWSSVDEHFEAPKDHPDWDVMLDAASPFYLRLALRVFGIERLRSMPELRKEMATYRDIIERLPDVTPEDAKTILPYLRNLSDYTETIR